MKNQKYILLAVLTMLLNHTSSLAAEEGAWYSGRIGVGFMALNSGDNLNPNSSDKYIDSLDTAADMESNFLPLVLPEATWSFGNKRENKLFFNTEPPIDAAGGFAFNIGTSIPSVSGTIYQMSVFASPFEKAWKNPYLTGARREETDTSKYGARLAFNRIMGSNFRLNLVYMLDEVEDDEIGDLNPAMARDGAVYALTGNYSYNFSKSLELRPQLSIRKGDYDGDSSSYIKYKASMKANYRNGRFMAAPEIFYSYTDHDEIDQIFNSRRENDSYGISLMLNYIAPFGFDDYSIMSLAGYSKGDSSIDFYDTEAVNFGVFITYMF